MSEENNHQVANFSVYHAGSVLANFNIAAENCIEAQAMRFVHKMVFQDNLHDSSSAPLAVLAKDAVDLTVDNIAFRYDLYKEFADNFFSVHHAIDYDALKLAVICGDRVTRINELVEIPPACEHDNDNEAKTKFRNDGIDDEKVMIACGFMSDAEDLRDQGRYDPRIKIDPEALFLGHILCFEKLLLIEDRMEDPDDHNLDEIELFLKTNSRDFFTVADPDSGIGQKLLEYLDKIEDEAKNVFVQSNRSIAFFASVNDKATELRKKPIFSIVPAPQQNPS